MLRVRIPLSFHANHLSDGAFDPSSLVKGWAAEKCAEMLIESGTYECEAHINDAYAGVIAIGATSATVVGPSGWLCDGLATAMMVADKDRAKCFAPA